MYARPCHKQEGLYCHRRKLRHLHKGHLCRWRRSHRSSHRNPRHGRRPQSRSSHPQLLPTRIPGLTHASTPRLAQAGGAAIRLPCRQTPPSRKKAHKNPDFVLETPENGGSDSQKRTKIPILCSKRLKTRVSKPKSAQKPRFCARNARKRRFRRPKKHKNLDFVLGKGEIGIGKHNRGAAYRKLGLPANHRAHLQNANTL